MSADISAIKALNSKHKVWNALTLTERTRFLTMMADFLMYPVNMLSAEEKRSIAFKFSKSETVTIDYTGNGTYRKRTLRSNENIGLVLKKVRMGATGLLLCMSPVDEESGHKVSDDSRWHLEMPIDQLLRQFGDKSNIYRYAAPDETNAGDHMIQYMKLVIYTINRVVEGQSLLPPNQDIFSSLVKIMSRTMESIAVDRLTNPTQSVREGSAAALLQILVDPSRTDNLSAHVAEVCQEMIDGIQKAAEKAAKEAMHIVYHDIIEEFGDFS